MTNDSLIQELKGYAHDVSLPCHVRVAIEDAIAAMGDASNRKTEEVSDTGGVACSAPSPANPTLAEQAAIAAMEGKIGAAMVEAEYAKDQQREIRYNEDQFIHELAGWLHGRFSGLSCQYEELDSRQRKEWREDARIILNVYAKRHLCPTEPVTVSLNKCDYCQNTKAIAVEGDNEHTPNPCHKCCAPDPVNPILIVEHISRYIDPAAWQACGVTSGELTLEMNDRRQRSLGKAEQLIHEIDKYRNNPISLHKCLIAAIEVDKNPATGYMSIIKAVLDAAGVKYVD